MKAWIKAHKLLTAAIVAVVALVAWRISRGLSLTSGGHATPEDAIAWGWSVSQMGITGWIEVSPDGNTRYEHETGWTGDPYSKGG